MLGFKNSAMGLTTGKIVAVFKDSNEAVTDSIELNKITWSTKSDDEDIQMFQEINSVIGGLKNSKRF